MRARLEQFVSYLAKDVKQFFDDKMWKTPLGAAIASVIVCLGLRGSMYKDEYSTAYGVQVLVLVCVMCGLINSVRNIVRDRGVISKDHSMGGHISPYVFAQLIYQAAICLAEALVLTSSMGLIVGFPRNEAMMGGYFFEFFMTFFFTLVAADALGMLVSSVTKSINSAMPLTMVVLAIEIVLGGGVTELNGFGGAMQSFAISHLSVDGTKISADYNGLDTYVNLVASSRLQQMSEQHEDVLPRETMRTVVSMGFGETVDYDPAYERTRSNLASIWVALFLHIILYTALTIISLEFIDTEIDLKKLKKRFTREK